MSRVALLACVGCASVPPAEDSNVRGGPELTVYDDGAEISGTGFSMSFAKTGVRLPTSLIHGEEVFGTSSCPTPSRAGVSVAPFQTAVGERMASGFDQAKNTLDVTMAGPAVVEIAVAYEVPYACEGPQALRGTATFTLFPSGRIVRRDTVQASTGQMITNATACTETCNGVQRDATLEVFWALRAGSQRSRADDTPIAAGSTVDGEMSCAANEIHTAAIAWGSSMTRAGEPVVGQALLYTHELFDKLAAVPQATLTSTSVILVAPGRELCSTVMRRLRVPPAIVFDSGTPRDVMIDASGIYSDVTTGDRVEVRPRAGESIDDGFAVRLAIRDPEHLRLRRSNGEKPEYTVQRDGAATLMIEGL
jgi:hypothetical protein